MVRTLRAGIIGSTGHGNYGHQIDTAYEGLSSVEVVAVTDPDTAGREAAAARTGANKLYADYREMLLAEDLDAADLRAGSTDALPKLHGALLKNEQDIMMFERLAFMARRQS